MDADDQTSRASTGRFHSQPRDALQSWYWILGCFAVLAVLLMTDERFFRMLHGSPWSYQGLASATYREQGLAGFAAKVVVRVLDALENWGETVYVTTVAIAIWRLDRRNRSRLLCMVVASISVTLAIEVVKRGLGRERPDYAKGALILTGPLQGNTGGDFQSFPSGHVGSAAAYSGSLAAFYPPLRGLAAFMTIGTSMTRILKERHFPSDCWAAATFGFWFAFTLPRRKWMTRVRERFDQRFSERGACPSAVQDYR